MIAATTVTAQNYKTKITSAGHSQIQQFSVIPENEINNSVRIVKNNFIWFKKNLLEKYIYNIFKLKQFLYKKACN